MIKVVVVAMMTVLSPRSLNLEVTDFFLWGHVNYGLPRPQGADQHSPGRDSSKLCVSYLNNLLSAQKGLPICVMQKCVFRQTVITLSI
jgi:hypothetical protein